MNPPDKPTLAAYWGDTRKILTHHERATVLPRVVLESITPTEVLGRDQKTNRLIVITSVDVGEIFCDVCDKDTSRHTYHQTCPHFATCVADNPLDPAPGNGLSIKDIKKNGK